MRSENQDDWIIRQAELLTGESFSGPPRVFEDTTNFMYIDRGHFIRLDGELFLVRGIGKEGRFGLDEQPKFWVKRVISLPAGSRYLLKLACEETFKIQIGTLQIRCTRSATKEAHVLQLVQGKESFMQGRSARDSQGNLIRVIDHIDGVDLLNHVDALRATHEQYFHELFPSILARTITAIRAIQFLNENGLCHGDIRNDHILIERGSGRFRWIDFDLTQDFSDFDLWSLGNVLHFVVAKGFLSFRDAIQKHPQLSGRFTGDDASLFFPHRVMNLGKVYPYIPAKLNRIVMRFSAGSEAPYDSIHQLACDLAECSEEFARP